VEVDDLVELFDAAKALAVYTPAKIEKVLVVSSSGGMGVQITDALNAAGLSVPELPKDVQEELRRRLLPIAVVANPVDLTGAAWMNISAPRWRWGLDTPTPPWWPP